MNRIQILLFLSKAFVHVLELSPVFLKFCIELLQSLFSVLSHSVEFFVLILLLSESVLFHSLQFSFFLFKFLLFHCNIDIQLFLHFSLRLEYILLTLLELIVSLFEIALNYLTDVNRSLLELVKDSFELCLVAQLLLKMLCLGLEQLLLLLEILVVLLLFLSKIDFMNLIHLCSFLIKSCLNAIPDGILGFNEHLFCLLVLLEKLLVV